MGPHLELFGFLDFFFAMVCSAANIIIWNHHNWPLNEAYAFVYARPQANISHLHCSELKSFYFFTFASFSILKASRFWLPPVPLPEQVYYWNWRIFYLLAISGTEIQHILKKKKEICRKTSLVGHSLGFWLTHRNTVFMCLKLY